MDGGGIDVDALYQKYGPMVLRRCRRILGDDDEALDVMQEVFVRVWTHRETLDVTYPSSLLFRIATNLSLNRLRTPETDISHSRATCSRVMPST